MLDTFSPEHVIDVLSRKGGAHACSLFMAVPPMYVRIMDVLGKRRPDFSHVRLWASGSAPLPAHDFQRITQVLGKEPVEREGMSETGMNFSNPLRGPKKPGSVGLALPGLEVRVADPETLVDVAPGQEGEIWLKGPGVTPGYWRKPQDTAESFRAGWFRTGDLGRVDREGYYFLTDRLKHLIISGGENVAPKEVESAMGRSPDVMESCVVGIPHRLWGEKVVAAVVPKPGSEVNPADIKAWCARHLHPWKCPKEIIVVKELPRNAMGKVLREEVKRIFDRRDLSP
jgi:malonyl-CoA/methylmalonyl-CoA synthetase